MILWFHNFYLRKWVMFWRVELYPIKLFQNAFSYFWI